MKKLIIFLILISTIFVSGYITFTERQNETVLIDKPEKTKIKIIEEQQTILETPIEIIKKQNIISLQQEVKSKKEEPEKKVDKQTEIGDKIILKINNTEYKTVLPENYNVYDLIKKLSEETDFSFSGKEHSGLGYFIEEINGIKNNNKTGQYWIYYINGESAKVGISNYIINKNDIIEWKYENSNF
jgi:seryl-tRNA synthetase